MVLETQMPSDQCYFVPEDFYMPGGCREDEAQVLQLK